MSTRDTTASNLQKVIDEELVTVQKVRIEPKDIEKKEKVITPDQFKEDIDFYMESGIFTDTLDFKYELCGNNLTVYIGNMSSYCDRCITVTLLVNDGVDAKEFEKVFRKVEED